MTYSNMTLTFKKNYYKLQGGVSQFRKMYNAKGTVSKNLAKIIKENPDLNLPKNFKYL